MVKRPTLNFEAVPADMLESVGVWALLRWNRYLPGLTPRVCPCCGGLGLRHEENCPLPVVVALCEVVE